MMQDKKHISKSNSKHQSAIVPEYLEIINDFSPSQFHNSDRFLGYTLFIICTSGRGDAVVNRGKVTIDAGEALPVMGGHNLKSFSAHDDFKGYIVAFNKEFIKDVAERHLVRVYTHLSHSGKIQLGKLRLDAACNILNITNNLIESRINNRREILQNLMRAMLLTDISSMSTIRDVRTNTIVTDFVDAIERADCLTFKISDYASQKSISVRTLTRYVTESIGLSPNEILDHKKIFVSKSLLRELDYSQTIERLSQKLGFSNQQSFTRYFRSRTGMTPSEYLKSL